MSQQPPSGTGPRSSGTGFRPEVTSPEQPGSWSSSPGTPSTVSTAGSSVNPHPTGPQAGAQAVAERDPAKAGEVVDQVQEQASRAQGFLQRQLAENPLAVGAAAVALGAALGRPSGLPRGKTRSWAISGIG
jgi:hypothetical protein